MFFLYHTDLSHSETRLSIYLDSFVLNVYNRTSEYSRLEQLFGLEQLITGYQNTADVPNASDGSPDHTAAKYAYNATDSVSVTFFHYLVI